MEMKTIGDNILEIDGKVRIESGPAKLKAIATHELLDDNSLTASHYHLPRRERVKDEKTGKMVEKTVHAIDRLGKPIVEGKEFDYVDWTHTAPMVFYVYRLEANPDKEATNKNLWQLKGEHATNDAAMSQAMTLAAETEGSN